MTPYGFEPRPLVCLRVAPETASIVPLLRLPTDVRVPPPTGSEGAGMLMSLIWDPLWNSSERAYVSSLAEASDEPRFVNFDNFVTRSSPNLARKLLVSRASRPSVRRWFSGAMGAHPSSWLSS